MHDDRSDAVALAIMIMIAAIGLVGPFFLTS